LLIGTALALLGLSPAAAQAPADLGSLSIEDLASIEVTSVSKRSQPLSEAPAAIYVIGSEDIRRSAATSLAEVLRLAPNLQVQQIDARQYAISARGFNGYETSNKLLGLIDGRTIYTTLHAGIFWDLHEPVLEDLDQIEVVSGPGGTLWGPNAVNGVINIVTKSALDTQGALVRATAGVRERTGALRYGGALGDSGGYRLYASLADREGLPDGAGFPNPDGTRGYQLGFRADWGGEASRFMAQGELFDQDLGLSVSNQGHHLLARWDRDFSDRSALQVQAYYDSFKRRFPGVLDTLDNFDLSVQQNLTLGRHRMVFGGGLRLTHDTFINQLNPFVLDPPSRHLWLGNLFVQDTIALSDQLDLIAGLKLERSSFTGTEFLPNIRVAWRPADQTLLWGAVSRSVRTPSRIDRDLILPGFLLGGTFDSEEVIAFELGYRGQPTANTSVSISFFYNIYDGLRTTEPDPLTFLPVRLANGLKGHSYGLEAWASHQAAAWWRLSAGVSTLHKAFTVKKGHVDLQNGISLGNDPDFQLLLRSQADLTRTLQFDLSLRGVDSLPRPHVRGYVEADARLGWAVDDQIELFVSGSNLLHKLRDESGDPNRGQLVARRIAAGTRLRF
jgi:iron complex outermembrane receptor protein